MPHIAMLTPLLALLLLVFLPRQVALPVYMPIAMGSLAMARKAMRAELEPPASGREAMASEQAAGASVANGQAEVHAKGETWRAVSAQPLQLGEQVPIEAVERLTLRVAPEAGKIRDENGGFQE